MVLRTPFNEVQGQLSPDGQWLAYTSDESGSWEVYVQSLARPAERTQVSRGGGSDPEWAKEGRELCYVSNEPALMCAPYRAGLKKVEFERLFGVPGSQHLAPYLSAYDIAADGQRVLLRIPLESTRTAPLQVRANWMLFTRPGH